MFLGVNFDKNTKFVKQNRETEGTKENKCSVYTHKMISSKQLDRIKKRTYIHRPQIPLVCNGSHKEPHD